MLFLLIETEPISFCTNNNPSQLFEPHAFNHPNPRLYQVSCSSRWLARSLVPPAAPRRKLRCRPGGCRGHDGGGQPGTVLVQFLGELCELEMIEAAKAFGEAANAVRG